MPEIKRPSEIDYVSLGFSYTRTPYNVRIHYSKGKWGEIQISDEPNISIHMASTALHYGQQAFEGLKALRGEDGKVRVFRMEENAKRMQSSAEYLQMAQPPVELFCEAVEKVVKLNLEYVPPIETGGSLYIRPVLFGVGPTVGVRPSEEYMLLIFATPVGGYFQNDAVGIDVIVDRKHDRSGGHGTGHVKAGGNYASALKSGEEARKKGYHSVLYLDPVEHRYIDECGAANFFGIKGNTYVTPVSSSILPSITNRTLQQLALDMGMEVECRQIDFLEEVESFEEIGACGTAAVIAPVLSIYDPESERKYHFDGKGTKMMKLLERYRAIQRGTAEDTHNWTTLVE
ncbi:MAG: branched-chain amino acid aminotransferase [Rikenellaceae bacterium]